jgi:hypothetical protein
MTATPLFAAQPVYGNRSGQFDKFVRIFIQAVANGMRTLKMDWMEKVLMGLTDIKQVRAVCIN